MKRQYPSLLVRTNHHFHHEQPNGVQHQLGNERGIINLTPSKRHDKYVFVEYDEQFTSSGEIMERFKEHDQNAFLIGM